MNPITLEKIKAVVIGHAVGDALGVPVEFCSREELDSGPVDDMEGFGTYPYPAGTWSDDTSMSLCALESLAKGDVDYDDVMRNFGRWYYKDEFTPTGKMFDVGNTCSYAIENYFTHRKSICECGLTDEYSNGNGSLMRILPFVLFTEYGEYAGNWLDIIHQASALTHAHERCKVGCGIYAHIMRELLAKPVKESIRLGLNRARRFYKNSTENKHYSKLYSKIGLVDIHFEDLDTFELAKREDIKSTGYIVDTLEAAVWCVLNTHCYSECVLTAVNLGDDTDTVAAVAGGMAGALYGYESIPKEWRDTLIKRDYIEEMCERVVKTWI